MSYFILDEPADLTKILNDGELTTMLVCPICGEPTDNWYVREDEILGCTSCVDLVDFYV